MCSMRERNNCLLAHLSRLQSPSSFISLTCPGFSVPDTACVGGGLWQGPHELRISKAGCSKSVTLSESFIPFSWFQLWLWRMLACVQRRQFFTHSSLWSSSIIPQDASSSQGSLYFPLPLWNSWGRNSPSSIFHSRNKRVYQIPLKQWSYLLILLQMLAPHSCLSGSAWFHLWGEDHPETPSSGDEGGFLVPCLKVGREWVTLNLARRRPFITILNNCLKTLNVKSAWRYPSDKAIKSELLLYLLYIYNFKVFFILSKSWFFCN